MVGTYRERGEAPDPWDGAPLVAVLSIEAMDDLAGLDLHPVFTEAEFDIETANQRLEIRGPLPQPGDATHAVMLLTRNGTEAAAIGDASSNRLAASLLEERQFVVDVSPRGVHILAYETAIARVIESSHHEGGQGPWSASFSRPDERVAMTFLDHDLRLEVTFLGIWPRANVTVVAPT